MDQQSFLDEVHLPSDAGEFATGLERILRRIPPGWGRWISCGPGWYPLLVRLDSDLAQLLPEYEVHQAKEKFGTLRYYIGVPAISPSCCIEMDKTDPRPFNEAVRGPMVPVDRSAEKQELLDAWLKRRIDHYRSSEHRSETEALSTDPLVIHRGNVSEKVRSRISHAEAESARTCEECAAPGSLMVSGSWYQTLCAACASARGYEPVDETS